MIVDSLARQFLLKNKHILRISVIEDDLGITGKSIFKWISGKRPLPDKWADPLYEYLYPLLDQKSKVHKQEYVCDKVVVLSLSHVLPEYKHIEKVNLTKSHFSEFVTNGADVIYFRSINKNGNESYLSIYSQYLIK
jgi:hypothetical protein